MSFQINQLPSELLSDITPLLTGFEIGRLWLCGDSLLCSKLKSGGVRKWDLDWIGRLRTPFWPSMLSEFDHLQSLRIYSMRPLNEQAMKRFVSQMKPSLQHLDLHSEIFASTWHSRHLLPHLAHLTSLNLLSTHFQPSDHVKLLPKSLRTLGIGLSSGSLFELLPSAQLQSLSVKFPLGEIIISAKPFKVLKSLSIDSSSSYIFIKDSLPHQLQRLKTRYHFLDATSKKPAVLPTGLKHLIGLTPIGFESISLPRSLISLELLPSLESSSVGHYNVSNLPQSLTSLILPSELALAPADLIHLPSTLTHLECALSGSHIRNMDIVNDESKLADAKMREEMMPTLPPSVTSFILIHVYENPMPILPPRLSNLSWHIWNVEPTKWPQTLETMIVTLFDRLTVWTDPNRITSLEEMIKYRQENEPWLPKGLKTLDMKPKTPTQLFLILPSFLTSLRIDCGTCIAPISVSRRELSFFMEDPDEYEATEEEEEEEEIDVFERMFPPGWAKILPPSLISLVLNIPNKNIDNTWVEDLPCQSLKTLTLSAGARFDSSKIDLLPPHLTSLSLILRGDIDWNSIHLHQRKNITNLHLKTQSEHLAFPSDCPSLLLALPPKVLHLSLHNSPITPLQVSTLINAHIVVL